jgi:[glutamine synthetase] adenylyltransferase / [glutamine synthetase]-adenylyl-L-tyrosine phosphorylase
MRDIESFIRELPDAEAVQRFFDRLRQTAPREADKLVKNDGLLSDVLTLAAYSPLLTATLLQNPQYFAWLDKKRRENKVREKEELLESLARFTLTHSGLETNVLLSRFQRRELLRIYLRDIRGLATISELTQEVSNLADAILEHALRLARQELDNRYGAPQYKDEKGRDTPAKFSIVSLGKLGSRELNYASDIDLFFLYSYDGTTSGAGSRGSVTNKEYFIKLAELVAKLVGQQAGEGAAYRVDLRLRPHGRIGPLTLSLKETLEYYHTAARDWERQVLLRARNSAGDAALFKNFYAALEDVIYQKDVSLEQALKNVRLSKELIDQEQRREEGFNVKLGRGGIREIEFIAQAPQLALGGPDAWLRAPHTLISLSRLADRGLLGERELTQLSDAYAFLRTLEHRLQMENGLQTHAVPDDAGKRGLIARRMNFAGDDAREQFEAKLAAETENVSLIYQKLFGALAMVHDAAQPAPEKESERPSSPAHERTQSNFSHLKDSWGKYLPAKDLPADKLAVLLEICSLSDYFSGILAADPSLIDELPALGQKPDIDPVAFSAQMKTVVEAQDSFRAEIDALRAEWSRVYLQIGVGDLLGTLSMRESNVLQTALAEASLTAGLLITEREMARRGQPEKGRPEKGQIEMLRMSILGLGRLGGRGMDHGSDLDLILVYESGDHEFYQAAAEILVTAISSFTRHGNLYRVDLRLRPDGKNGALCCPAGMLLEYVEKRAAIWEWLAYVKLRAVAGDAEFGARIEQDAKRLIHGGALQVGPDELKKETLRVRLSLESERTRNLRQNETDIKYSAGGLLDIYFLIRYLQLKNGVQDEDGIRSTLPMLEHLKEKNILSDEHFDVLSEGYLFLRRLDHALRLAAGRATRLPGLGHPLLDLVVKRLNVGSAEELNQILSAHRVEIRQTFDDLLS